MRKALRALLAAAFLGGAAAAPSTQVKLWQLDCGTIHFADVGSFDDTFSLAGQPATMNTSCYLIKHGETYMLWDTGLPARYLAASQAGGLLRSGGFTASYDQPLVNQLAKLGIAADQIAIVAISHHHLDHAGQAALFPHAQLLIGFQDLAAVVATPPPPGAEPALLAPWLSAGANVEPVKGDKDIFGDGSVIMFATPGHTPGHHSLLVRLKRRGPVLLSGDLYHLRAQRKAGGVPIYNPSRADTLASFDRFNRMVRALHATIVIQHDMADKQKLAKFPEANE